MVLAYHQRHAHRWIPCDSASIWARADRILGLQDQLCRAPWDVKFPFHEGVCASEVHSTSNGRFWPWMGSDLDASEGGGLGCHIRAMPRAMASMLVSHAFGSESDSCVAQSA